MINGEAVDISCVCYINASGEMIKATADVIANSSALLMSTASGASGASVAYLVNGFARDDAWTALTAGSFVYLSAATAGAITKTAPAAANNVIQILGWAKTTKTIYFNPCLVQVEHV